MEIIASVFAGQIRNGPLENIDKWKKQEEKTAKKISPLRLPENSWSGELCLVIFKKNKK